MMLHIILYQIKLTYIVLYYIILYQFISYCSDVGVPEKMIKMEHDGCAWCCFTSHSLPPMMKASLAAAASAADLESERQGGVGT